jgi:hypothetical protein
VGGALHSAVISGGRIGTPGEPFPEDVEQRDWATEIADQLPKGSIQERFYRSLAQHAVDNMRWQIERDQELLERREW